METIVPYAGRCLDQEDIDTMKMACDDAKLTAGRFTKQFETKFAKVVGKRYAFSVNSGSSANLLALASLMDPSIPTPLKPGDKVVTLAAGFPTTVNPIIQLGMIPVFVDITLGYLNAKMMSIEEAIQDSKVRCIMLPHTLGNPFDSETLFNILNEHNRNDIYVIHDCCDALGTKWNGKPIGDKDIQTYSFYPAHHITCGEAGMVTTNHPVIAKVLRSMRAWGRDCVCDPGENNRCGHRYDGYYGKLPHGYDHRYVYSTIGFNFQITEMQAALGVSQLKKLPKFLEARKRNFDAWYAFFKQYPIYFILPKWKAVAEPAWFSFPLTVRINDRFSRNELLSYLAEHGIETRCLFAGNITKQPAYKFVKYECIDDLSNTDIAMEQTFFLGVYPGIDQEKMQYAQNVLTKFFQEKGI